MASGGRDDSDWDKCIIARLRRLERRDFLTDVASVVSEVTEGGNEFYDAYVRPVLGVVDHFRHRYPTMKEKVKSGKNALKVAADTFFDYVDEATDPEGNIDISEAEMDQLYASYILSLEDTEIKEMVQWNSPDLCRYLLFYAKEWLGHEGRFSQNMAKSAENFTMWLKKFEVLNNYPLPIPPKVIIIYTTRRRAGCEEEEQSIEESLHSWPSVQSEILKDPTKAVVESTIKNTHEELLSALIVIIMSHGSPGHFEVADGEINIQYFLDNILYSRKTENIPKIAVIQACQNEATHTRPSVHVAREFKDQNGMNDYKRCPGRSTSTVGTPAPQSRSTSNAQPTFLKYRHTAVIMSTAYGTESRRKLMITKLAEHLRAGKGKTGDVFEAFKKTAADIEGLLPEQVPSFNSTFTKNLCLADIFQPEKDHGFYKSLVTDLIDAFID